jgi:cell wall-associated NlpC family hydrolase
MLCICLAVIPSLSHAAKTHKVKKTETLNSLARKYHVSVDELKSANNLVSAQVKKGDILIIPPRNLQADSATSEKENPATYKVKRGDTVARIAKKTGVAVADLRRLNNLGKKRLKLGQVIALREVDASKEEIAVPKVAKRYSLRYSELLSEKEYEQSLSDLTEADPSIPSDIHKPVAEAQPDNAKQLKNAAYGFLGTRYRFGGNSRSGLDCSAFVQQVFRELEVSLPRSAREQFEVGSQVPLGDLKKGDLVFFRTYARYPSHVGIYLGGNRMIHASSRDRRVVISSLNSNYYRSRYLGAKRISKINPDLFRFDDLLTGIEEESADEADKNDTLNTLGISLNN